METNLDQKLTKRFIVLITDRMANNHTLAHAIHSMADSENLPVLYLVLVDDNENMLAAARDMATMKAVTAANRLLVEVNLTNTNDWFETLSKIAGSGDIIICQEEQMVANGLFKTIPISDFLSSHLNSTVRPISGYFHSIQTDQKERFPEIFALIGFLVILAFFTWVQIRVDLALDGTLAIILVLIAFCIEMIAVWAWYKFSYR